MRRFYILCFVFMGAAFYTSAQDMLVLRDGNIIESKITEISPTEIRYKRFDHLDGPTIVVPAASVLSIRYENGKVEIIGASPLGAAGVPGLMPGLTPSVAPGLSPGVAPGAVSDLPTALQTILNGLPAIPIAGNNLKFIFNSDKWTATVNGENFLAGTIELDGTSEGAMLTLRQTHIWPGAVGRTAGRIAGMIPGGGAAAGALNTASSIAGAAGAIEASGPVIVLEFKAGPPARLSLVSSTTDSDTAPAANDTSSNKTFAMDPGKTIFALSIEPSGFLLYGPSLSVEFTKGKFNSQINLSFPSIGLLYNYDGFAFGLGFSLNYFHHTRIGGFYIGGLVDLSLIPVLPGHYSVLGNGTCIVTSLAMNIGYKFVLPTGIFFNVGGNMGIKWICDAETVFLIKPVLAFGYNFQ